MTTSKPSWLALTTLLALAALLAAAHPAAGRSPLKLAQGELREAIEEAKEAMRDAQGEISEAVSEAKQAAEEAASALETDRGDVVNLDGDVNIAADQTVEGDVVAVGGTAHVRGQVKGNVVAIDGAVHLYEGSQVKGDVIAAGGEVVREPGVQVGGSSVQISAPWLEQLDLVRAPREGQGVATIRIGDEGEIVRFGEDVQVAENEVVDGDVVALGGSADILGTVNGDVVAFVGPLDVKGQVNGDTVCFGGSLHLHSGSKVTGDAVAFGGKVQKDEGAELGGERVSFPGPWDLVSKRFLPGVMARHRHYPFRSRLIEAGAWVLGSLGLLVITILVVLVVPRHTEVIATSLAQEPGRTLLYGLIGWLVVLPILVILLLLVVTWILIPFYLVALAALLLVGAVGVYLFVGRRLAQLWNWQVQSVVALAVIGFVLLRIVDAFHFVPFAGFSLVSWAVFVVIMVFALGAALMTGFGTDPTGTWLGRRLSRRAAPPAAPQPAAEAPPQPPAQPPAAPPGSAPSE